jgi:hypothetical protein
MVPTPQSAVGTINPAVAPFLTPAAIQPFFAGFNCPPLATVNVVIDSDMFFRIRPTSMNGVVRTLLDENCEAADILGNPLPGSVFGGLTPTCSDSTLTVRMLEGDINLDCSVDIFDAGIIAFKYGSFFGSLLYDPFFDLEPKLTDFDIDIKDVQFITGRFGSTCGFAIPPQPPAAPIP